MKDTLKLSKLFVGILVLTFYSCQLIEKGNDIEVAIENASDAPIENVRFSTSENLAEITFDKIEPNESVSDILSMKDHKSDGSYTLEFTRSNGKRESKKFGYYSNGGALDKWITLKVQNDTITPSFSGTGN